MKIWVSFLISLWGLMFVQHVFGADPNQNEEYNLELKISCSEKSLLVGDEIPIIFTITNKGERAYQYEIPNYDRSSRMPEYQLNAGDKNGNSVPDPRENVQSGLGGGLSAGMATISKGQSFDHTSALNRWALINKPGKYTVTATYTYVIEDKNAIHIPGIRIVKTIEVKSKPIEIEIKSRSSSQMGSYIKSLQKELKKYSSPDNWEIQKKREEVILKLDYTCDKRIIPTLMDLIYLNQHNNDVFWAIEGFGCYLPKTPEIKNKVIDTIRKRGFADGAASVLEAYNCDESIFKELLTKALNSDNPDVVSRAALAAQNHPSDEIMPLVIAVAKGESPNDKNVETSEIARQRAIYALACNRTDDVVKVLRELKNESNDRNNKMAQYVIEQAYRIHPIYPEKADEEYTAMLIPAAMDTNYPRSMSFIIEILRTRTKEGVEAIKKLAENPELNLPVAETDSGVKAIRDLLRSPNEQYQTMLADYIKFFYKINPGRAFRKDDFPDEFQEILKKRKEEIIKMVETWKELKK